MRSFGWEVRKETGLKTLCRGGKVVVKVGGCGLDSSDFS